MQGRSEASEVGEGDVGGFYLKSELQHTQTPRSLRPCCISTIEQFSLFHDQVNCHKFFLNMKNYLLNIIFPRRKTKLIYFQK